MAYTAPMPLVSLFTEVEDPRRQARLFGHQRQAWLKMFLVLPHGIPSHDTFERVFARLVPQPLEGCFTLWVQSLTAALRDPVPWQTEPLSTAIHT